MLNLGLELKIQFKNKKKTSSVSSFPMCIFTQQPMEYANSVHITKYLYIYSKDFKVKYLKHQEHVYRRSMKYSYYCILICRTKLKETYSII